MPKREKPKVRPNSSLDFGKVNVLESETIVPLRVRHWAALLIDKDAEELKMAAEPRRLTAYQYCPECPGSGVRIVCQAGFDPNGGLILMDNFAEHDPTANSFTKNHPAAIQRRNYLLAEVRRFLAHRPQTSSAAATEVQPVYSGRSAPLARN